jgi:hypothetical protein
MPNGSESGVLSLPREIAMCTTAAAQPSRHITGLMLIDVLESNFGKSWYVSKSFILLFMRCLL